MPLMLVGLFGGKIESNAKKKGYHQNVLEESCLDHQCTGGISNVDNIVGPILLQRYHDELGFQQPEALKALSCQLLHKLYHKY